ncbi:MAG: gliding motility-associated C-terminal domain-containing protein, partial [Saprospiraceae bacterium]
QGAPLKNVWLPYSMTSWVPDWSVGSMSSDENILTTSNLNLGEFVISDLELDNGECQEFQLRHPSFLNPMEWEQQRWSDTIWAVINLPTGVRWRVSEPNYEFHPTYLAECDYENNRDFIVTSFANWHVANTEITICDNETTTLVAPDGYESYEWQNGSIELEYTVQQAGKYWVEMVDGCGKVVTDTFTVFTPDIQQLQFPDTIFSCRNQPLVIDVPYFQRAQWFPVLDCGDCVDFTITPTENQTYEVLANDENGCYSLDTVNIQIVDPLVQTLDTFACKNAVFTFDEVDIPAANSQTFNYMDQYGCDSIWIINVAESDATAYYIEIDTSICANEVLQYENRTFLPDTTVVFSYQTFDGCDSIITLNINELPIFTTNEVQTICGGDSLLIFNEYQRTSGIYMSTFSAINGCDSVHTIELNVLSELAVSALVTPTCENIETGEITVLVSGGLPPYQYIWSNGLSNQAAQIELPADDYQLTITDDFGCQIELEFIVERPIAEDFILTTIPTSCFGATDGRLFVENATPAFLFQIDNGELRSLDQMNNFAAGTYDLIIFNENNCPYERTFLIEEPDELLLEISADTTIKLGESLVLKTKLNRAQSFDYQWFPTDGLSCNDCSEPVAQPIETTTYELLVSNGAGCSAQATVTIEVTNIERLYLPTVFSPNGDGVNDEYTVFGGTDIKEIISLRIFDRWGGEVFVGETGERLEWNGRRNGELVPNGIYIVQVVAERVNGQRIVRATNITVVR